jgi:uncharacterized membrane-anchored protein
MPVTLTDLLSLVSITTPITCAITEGQAAGILGISTGLVVGAGVGVVCCWSLRAIIKRAALHPKLGPGETPLWRFLSYLLVAALFVWLFVTSFVAMSIMKAFVRYVVA